FAGLAPSLRRFHQHTLQNFNYSFYRPAESIGINEVLPENHSLDHVANGLVRAHRLYQATSLPKAILVVIEDGPANVVDQKKIEWKAQSLQRELPPEIPCR